MKKENEYTFSKKQIEDIIRKTITDYFESNGIPTQLLYPNSTRVWFSYDIDNDTNGSKHELLEKVLQSFNAKSWGNSVATFLIKDKCYNSNTELAKYLIDKLIEGNVLLKGNNWKTTPDISVYIFYQSMGNEENFSNHFILIQNARITHETGF